MVSLKQGKLSKRFQPQDLGSTNFMFISTLFKIDVALYALYYDALRFMRRELFEWKHMEKSEIQRANSGYEVSNAKIGPIQWKS